MYQALAQLTLPVSAMDIRKVQNVVREICEGGKIQVSITEDLEELKNSDKVLVVGSKKTIKYEFLTTSEMMANYFQIIEESNSQLLKLIDKQKIQPTQYFPIYAFSKICPEISVIEELKKQQKEKINAIIKDAPISCKGQHDNPLDVNNDSQIAQSYKTTEIIKSIMSGSMNLDMVKEYLCEYDEKKSTDYRKILCAYDLKKYE